MSRKNRGRNGWPKRMHPPQPPRKEIKYPLATVIPYGPDDRTVTKIAVGIIKRASAPVDPVERWTSTRVTTDERIAGQIRAFLNRNHVKTVMMATAVLGCPHEEGEDKDIPKGEDCPFCPFWRGKQGSGSADTRWDDLSHIVMNRWPGPLPLGLPIHEEDLDPESEEADEPWDDV